MSASVSLKEKVVDYALSTGQSSTLVGARFDVKPATVRTWIARAKAAARIDLRAETRVKKLVKELAPTSTSATVREAVRSAPPQRRLKKPATRKAPLRKGRVPVADLEPETRDQVVRIVRGTYDLVETALRNELSRLEIDVDDLSEVDPIDAAYLSRLDPKVASAVRAWQGTAAGLIDTHPGLLAIVKAGAKDTAASAAKRTARVAEALLGDEPGDALTTSPVPQNGQGASD